MPRALNHEPAELSDCLTSIIIPVHNGLPFISDTVESVRRQTFSDWELIICDNASTDGTRAWAEQYLKDTADPRLRLILNDDLLPMTQNWNRCLKCAQGKFIKLLPSDDILLPSCIEIQRRILEQRPDVGFVTSGKEVINSAGRVLFRKVPLREGEYDWDALGERSLRAVSNMFGEPGAILFRKELLERCGNYDDRFSYFVDIELLLRFLKVSKVFVCGAPLCRFRIHGSSASASSRRSALLEYRQLLDKYDEELRLSERPLLRWYLGIKSQLVVWLRGLVFRIYAKV